IFPASDGAHDLRRLGREISDHLRAGIQSALAARARIGEARFLDVHHRELAADPFSTLQRIYDWLGLEWPAPVQRAVRQWHEANRSGAHGAHRYTAEQFGLSAAQLRS